MGRLAEYEAESPTLEAAPVVPANVYAAVEALCRQHDPDLTYIRIVFGSDEGTASRLNVRLAGPREITATQQRIIDKLAASAFPLSRWQIAQQLKLKSLRGRFANDVSRLLGTGRIFEKDGSLADDPNKFGDMD